MTEKKNIFENYFGPRIGKCLPLPHVALPLEKGHDLRFNLKYGGLNDYPAFYFSDQTCI